MSARPRLPVLLALATSLPALASVLAPFATAGEVRERSALSLTLYQNGPALVEDVRKVSLDKGSNSLGFADVSDGLLVPSVQLVPTGATDPDFVVAARSFRPAASMTDLLRAVEGRDVILLRSTQTGDVREQAKVLRVDPSPLFSIDGTVRPALPGETVVFKSMPDGVALNPSLTAQVDTAKPTTTDLSLRYLSEGLSWAADHVVEISQDGKSLSLTTSATLQNQTSLAWRNVSLGLVAGEVAQVADSFEAQRPMAKGRMMVAAAPAPMAESMPTREELSSFHLYKVPAPVTLERGETKQVSLLSASGIKARTIYRFTMPSAVARVPDDRTPVPGQTEVSFKNDNASLAAPLPAGTVRVYTKDKAGAARYLGSDILAATPIGQEARLNLGSAFDVTAKRATTEFSQVSRTGGETISGHKIVVSNAGAEPVTVWIEENTGGERTILEESVKHASLDSVSVRWELTIPAKGSTTLTYKARVRDGG